MLIGLLMVLVTVTNVLHWVGMALIDVKWKQVYRVPGKQQEFNKTTTMNTQRANSGHVQNNKPRSWAQGKIERIHTSRFL